jgi:hypothetical protein
MFVSMDMQEAVRWDRKLRLGTGASKFSAYMKSNLDL